MSSVIWRALSSDAFKRRTATGSETFGLDITAFVLLKNFARKRGFASKLDRNLPSKYAKSSLPVTVRRSKTR